MRHIWFGSLLGFLVMAPALAAPTDADLNRRVERVLAKTPLIDGHNDLPWELRDRFKSKLNTIDLQKDTSVIVPPAGAAPLMTDIPRMRAGHMGGQFWSVWIPVQTKGPEAVQTTLEQIDLTKEMTYAYPADLEMAYTAADIRRIHKAGRMASLIGIEGGHQINGSLQVLREAYAAGARYMTLAHSTNTEWADSATDAPVHKGLTPFGREVVKEMNRIGMLIDLSHVSADTMKAALATSSAPVMFSHSSARALCDHPRNVDDEVLRLVAKNGGIVMVNFAVGSTTTSVVFSPEIGSGAPLSRAFSMSFVNDGGSPRPPYSPSISNGAAQNHGPSPTVTLPTALTTASAATMTPSSVCAEAEPRPPLKLAVVAPRPAPTLPSAKSVPAAQAAA